MDQEILINIGNTHAQFAVFDGDNVVVTEKQPTMMLGFPGLEIKTLSENPESSILIASVVPEVNRRIRELWKERNISFLSCNMLDWIGFSDVDVATVGADRLANIAAATALLPLPAVIVDCGTAITTEVVDAGANFLGGAIIPGRALWRKSLSDHTGQLPQIPLGQTDPSPIGKTTFEALQVMDCAVIGALERVVSKTTEAVKNAQVYLTGGDAPFFADNMEGVELLYDNFTLKGLAEVSKRIRRG